MCMFVSIRVSVRVLTRIQRVESAARLRCAGGPVQLDECRLRRAARAAGRYPAGHIESLHCGQRRLHGRDGIRDVAVRKHLARGQVRERERGACCAVHAAQALGYPALDLLRHARAGGVCSLVANDSISYLINQLRLHDHRP